MQSFIILTGGRTASSAIAVELDSHPEVVCHGELARPGAMAQVLEDPDGLYARFGDDYIRHGARDRALPLHVFARIQGRSATAGEFRAWLDYLDTEAAGARAVGFKAITNHLFAIEGALGVLRRRATRVVWLTRRNVLRQVVSAMIAGQTRVFNATTSPEAGRSFALEPDLLVHTVVEKAKAADSRERRLRGKDIEVLQLQYEDFVADRDGFHRRLAAFIGVAPHPLSPSSLAIMTPEPLRDLLSNYAEIAAALRQAGLDHYLEEA